MLSKSCNIILSYQGPWTSSSERGTILAGIHFWGLCTPQIPFPSPESIANVAVRLSAPENLQWIKKTTGLHC